MVYIPGRFVLFISKERQYNHFYPVHFHSYDLFPQLMEEIESFYFLFLSLRPKEKNFELFKIIFVQKYYKRDFKSLCIFHSENDNYESMASF